MPAAKAPEFRRSAVDLARRGDAPVRQVAKDLGISESCLRRWMAQDDADAGRREGLTSEERKELVGLRRRTRVLEMWRARFSSGRRRTSVGRTCFQDEWPARSRARRRRVPVAVTCRVLGISRSGFYEADGRAPSARTVADEALVATITQVHHASRATYGAPRVHAELRLGLGVRCGRKRVARLMRAAGLVGACHRRKRRGHRPAPAPLRGSGAPRLHRHRS